MNIKFTKQLRLLCALLLAQPVGIALAQQENYNQNLPLVINAGSGMILNSSALRHKNNNDVLQSFNKKTVTENSERHYYPNIPTRITNVVHVTNNIVNSDNVVVQTYIYEGTPQNEPINTYVYILKTNGHCYKLKANSESRPRIRVSKRFCQAN